MDAPIYVVGHRNPDTDSVCSAIAYAHLRNCLGDTRVRPARAGALNAETTFVLDRFGVPPPELLSDAAGLDLILVDHSEMDQALPHIERATIHEIWEHHRMGDLRIPQPIVIHCEPVGATATLIGERYFASGIEPPPSVSGLMIAAILSDTIGFRSATATAQDRAVAERLRQLAGVDLTVLDRELRRTAAAATERQSARALVSSDFKEFRMEGVRLGIGQVQVMGRDVLAARKDEILDAMRAICEARALSLVILMVTDVDAQSSDLWIVGDHLDAVQRAFGPIDRQSIHVPGCMSRKKQVVPLLESALAPGSDAA